MGTGTMLDLRRTDLRTTVLENPYWITSGEMKGLNPTVDDQDAVLFSFPITGVVAPGYGNSSIIVQEIVLEVNTAFIAATVAATIGKGTIATDAVTTGGVSTDVDVDEYWEGTDGAADFAATGLHYCTTGSNWVTDRIAGVGGEGYIITPADTAVPTVVLYLTSNNPITAGSAFLHMMITVVPVVS